MTTEKTQAKLTTVARFPENFFIENLAVGPDGSILVSVLNRQELWYIPAPGADLPVDPVLLHTLDSRPMGITETEPGIFYVNTMGDATLQRIDMRGWSPGAPARITRVLTFDDRSAALNGSCLVAARTILIADSIGGQIWRVDLADDGLTASARVWLKHDSMAFDPDNPLNPQPGVNGVRYMSSTNFLYYTSTTQKLFMRVAVDPATLEAAGEPQFVAGGTMADDFCIDEKAGVAYLTTHRENTLDRVPLEPAGPGAPRDIVAGDPFTDQLIGPSSAAWRRGPDDYGRVAYVSTDGGTTSPPPDGILRPAQVLRVELLDRAS